MNRLAAAILVGLLAAGPTPAFANWSPVSAVDGNGSVKPGKCLKFANAANTKGFQICQGAGASTDYQLKTFTGSSVLAETDQANGFFYSANSFYSGTGVFYTATSNTPVSLKGNKNAGAGPDVITDTTNAITGTMVSFRLAGVEKASISAAGDVVATAGSLITGNGLVTNNNALATTLRGQKGAGAGPDIILDTTNAITGTVHSFRLAGVEKANVDASGNIAAVGAFKSATGSFTTQTGNTSVTALGNPTDGASAVSVIVDSPSLATTGAKVLSVRNNGAELAYVDKSGTLSAPYVIGATPITLFEAYLNALLATGTTYAGRKVTKAFTVTDVGFYVSVASSATAANQVLTITDGTNTCTATFACDTVTNTTGVKNVAGVNGAGTGCVYAANALLTVSTTTQGCGTAATVKNIYVVGKWQ